MLEVTDDSGYLALIVPGTYVGFVDRRWKLDQLFEHFHRQMAQRSLLIWNTGSTGVWKVDVQVQKTPIQGFREVIGPIRVVNGTVLVTNYESLTMAAEYANVRLPEKHQEDLLIHLANGDYCCRIIQMFDPEEHEPDDHSAFDFVIEFSRADALLEPWSNVPWSSANGAMPG
jgi:hypothetical protein